MESQEGSSNEQPFKTLKTQASKIYLIRSHIAGYAHNYDATWPHVRRRRAQQNRSLKEGSWESWESWV